MRLSLWKNVSAVLSFNGKPHEGSHPAVRRQSSMQSGTFVVYFKPSQL